MTVTFGDLVQLISVIIWPLTLLIIVFKFKSFFGGAINRMQSLDASASGISMTFQNKLDEAKTLLSKMAPQLRDSAKSVTVSAQGSPYERVLKVKKELEEFLNQKARNHGIEATNQNPSNLSSRLSEIGLITFQQQKVINAALDLANSANPSITDDQAQVVEQLYATVK
ncbi:hypothetical protein [Leeuwenhoekiella nanhaiensis]|uniref:Uncharacterized protein n=1 Tax=Leeuwenhoekiella nanhaiensis TaxID=1655491 RepID=A0A2G1VUW7_9FLAO|nr:hypothetical protein [Leeuwenhoekiella nanhaiensis]PHQ30249.1 hypothetical protein CJ305_04610 [Leeuwenhoekiella nanhaiensis]